jgi:hypothetical protein
VLARRLTLQLIPQSTDALSRRQVCRLEPSRVFTKGLPFHAQRGDIERGRIHCCGQSRRRALEAVEQLIDAVNLHVLVEKAFGLQRVGNFRNEMSADPAHIRERRKHPDGRCPECNDAQRFERVARRPSRQKLLRQCVNGGIRALYAADLFDQESERRIYEVSIQFASPYLDRNGKLPHFPHNARTEAEGRTDDTLRQGDQVRLDAHAWMLLPCRLGRDERVLQLIKNLSVLDGASAKARFQHVARFLEHPA